MTRCLRCEAALDLGDDPQEAEIVVCGECSAEMEVVATNPLQLFLISGDEGDEEDDLDVFDDDDEEFPTESPY